MACCSSSASATAGPASVTYGRDNSGTLGFQHGCLRWAGSECEEVGEDEEEEEDVDDGAATVGLSQTSLA